MGHHQHDGADASRYDPGTLARRIVAGALSVASRGMAMGSFATATLARAVKPKPSRSSSGHGEDGPQPRPMRMAEPPTSPVPLVPEHTRTFATHVEALADKTAAEVVDAIPQLSTDELGRLYEHESRNKKRKTVLQAIEQQAAPTP